MASEQPQWNGQHSVSLGLPFEHFYLFNNWLGVSRESLPFINSSPSTSGQLKHAYKPQLKNPALFSFDIKQDLSFFQKRVFKKTQDW